MANEDKHDEDDRDEPLPSVEELLEQVRDVLRVTACEDPECKRRSCLSIGDGKSGALLLAALTNRFDRIVDLSLRPERSPWLQVELMRSVAPTVDVHSVDGDVFDERSLESVSRLNGGSRFEFCFMEKTLHHLRLNLCKLRKKEKDHRCGGEDCIGVFDPAAVFSRLFEFARTVIVSEHHYIGKDEDKDGARGGMLSTDEIEATFRWLSAHATFRVYSPKHIDPVPPIRSPQQFRKVIGQYVERTEYFLVSATSQADGRAGQRGATKRNPPPRGR
jgi:hypothetical protein